MWTRSQPPRETAAAERVSAKAAADAVKAAEREKQAALTATVRAQEKAAAAAQAKAVAEREAAAAAVAAVEREAAARVRLAAVVERGVGRSTIAPGRGGVIGATVPRGTSGQRGIPAAALGAGATEEVAVEKEVNHLLADRFDLQQRVKGAAAGTKRELGDQIDYLRRIGTYERAGLTTVEAQLRAEREMLIVQRGRVSTSKAGVTRGAEQFARGAGFNAATGGVAAVAGIGVAAAVYGGVQAIDSSLNFGRQIAETASQAGVTTKQLQVYQAAAREAGVSNEQLGATFGHLNQYLGRAKEGDEQAAKTFKDLGINIKEAASAGDVLPAVVEQLSKIKDPSERAAVGMRLFSEEYRRLDSTLGNGTGKIDALAVSMQRAGTILTEGDIKTLRNADAVLGELKQKLQVDLARVVAGNAGAITSLANSFVRAADAALRFYGALDRRRDLSIVEHPQLNTPFAALNGDTPESYRARAFNRQLATHEGRQALFDSNVAERDSLKGRASFGPDGKDRLAPDRERNARERQQILLSEGAQRKADREDAKPKTGKNGPVNIGNLFAPKPPKERKGPKGPSPEQLETEAISREKAYQDQLAGLQEAELRGQASLTGDIKRRAEIEGQLADRALKKQIADINATLATNLLKKGVDAGLEKAHAAELIAAARLASATQKSVIAQDTQSQLIQAGNDHLQTRLSIDAEILSSQAQLATTARERRAIELRLLDIQKQQERIALQADVKAAKPDSEAAKDAQTRLDSLDTRYAGREAGVRRGTESPLEQYRRELPRTADQINAALGSVKVQGLSSLDDAITGTIAKVVNLGGAFGGVANQIIASLIKIAVQRAIIGPLTDAVFGRAEGGHSLGGSSIGGDLFGLLSKGNGVGGSGGGFFGKGGGLGSVVKGIGSLFHFATGGSGVIEGLPGVDSNTLSINGSPVARVSTGERLAIVPSNIAPTNRAVASGGGGVTLHQTVHIDASGVNPEGFAKGIVGVVRRETAQAIQQSGRQILNDTPARIRSERTLGT